MPLPLPLTIFARIVDARGRRRIRMQIRQCTAFRLVSGDVIGAQVVEREPLSIFFSTSALLITFDHSVLKPAGLWWVAYRVENTSGHSSLRAARRRARAAPTSPA
ncbi:hypothetical protein WK05_24570 [Burkholderia ubonensis]|nr:hypothetical protein [Burkholderia ubonensis]KVO25976.1 hypothetical protein WJ72_26955 [Burkholderia ubonensis]KVQ63837.1 hypothetical protein WK05_24570 [Burkholderia ubonensis]